MNMPGHPNYWRQLAAVYGQLGRQEEANAAIARLLELEPDFVANAWEELFKGIHVVKFVEHLSKVCARRAWTFHQISERDPVYRSQPQRSDLP